MQYISHFTVALLLNRYKIVRILARNDAALPRIMRYNAHFNAAAYIVLCNISHTLLFQPAKDYAIYRILSCYGLHRVMRYIAHFYVATYKGLCDISHTFMLRATQGYGFIAHFSPQTGFRQVHKPVFDRSTNQFPMGFLQVMFYTNVEFLSIVESLFQVRLLRPYKPVYRSSLVYLHKDESIGFFKLSRRGSK